MRLAAFSFAAVLLASCGAPAEQDRTANQAVAPAPVPDSSSGDPAMNHAAPAEPEAIPAATVATTIPALFHGTYDENDAACAQPSQARLVVSAGELRFHESIGTVRKVNIESPGRIEVFADYQGEGESWQNVRTIELDGKRLTISGEGTRMARVRCPSTTS